MITKLGMWVGIVTLLNPINCRSGWMHRRHTPLTLIAKTLETEVPAVFLTELLMDDHQTCYVGWYCTLFTAVPVGCTLHWRHAPWTLMAKNAKDRGFRSISDIVIDV